MGIILQLTDATLAEFPSAYMRTEALIRHEGVADIGLYFWKNYEAHTARARLLFGGPLRILIPKSSKLYDDLFALPLLMQQGMTASFSMYQNFLKGITGTTQTTTFYKTITINDVPTQVVDVAFPQLLGINFSLGVDTFTAEQINLQLNGLQNPQEGYTYFDETQAKYFRWTVDQWVETAL